jgi:hypothetical protein
MAFQELMYVVADTAQMALSCNHNTRKVSGKAAKTLSIAPLGLKVQFHPLVVHGMFDEEKTRAMIAVRLMGKLHVVVCCDIVEGKVRAAIVDASKIPSGMHWKLNQAAATSWATAVEQLHKGIVKKFERELHGNSPTWKSI